MSLWITLNLIGVENWQDAFKTEMDAAAVTAEQRKEHADDHAWLVRQKQSDNFDAAIGAALHYIDPADILLACKVPDAQKDDRYWSAHNEVEGLLKCSDRVQCANLVYGMREMRQACMALALDGYATASHLVGDPTPPADATPAPPAPTVPPVDQ